METFSQSGTVETDYSVQSKITHSLLNAGYFFPSTITQGQKDCYARILESLGRYNIPTTTQQALDYAKNNCGFEFEHE